MENRLARNSGYSRGLEAWRSLQNGYDPTSNTRRVTICGYVKKPTRCDSIEDLGFALERVTYVGSAISSEMAALTVEALHLAISRL